MEVKSGQSELRMGKRSNVPGGSVGTVSPEKGNCSRTRGKKSNEDLIHKATGREKPGQDFPIMWE
jgi:hypothetical protein